MAAPRLGIDFGTSHTVAVYARPDGRTESLLFDASPLLPSAVYRDGDGRLRVGRDAERSARLDPAAFEPHPKRRIDEPTLLLGTGDIAMPDVVAAVLARVGEEAHRVLGGPPSATVLTHPTGWGPRRRAVLVDAAHRAGLPCVGLVAEPVAAAMYFTGVLGHRVADGQSVVVYDFGGGTFDISVVRRAGDDWEVVAAQGLDDVGGIDLDATVVAWVGATVAGTDPERWQRLDRPASTADRRHRRNLWDDARAVKELLSRAATAGLPVPLFDIDLHLTRPEFERLARPWLDRTIALTTATLFTGGVTSDRLAGVFLVGGGSRVPMVATLLHRALGVAPVVIEQPELVVAHGSLLAAGVEPAAAAGAVPPSAPVSPPTTPSPVSPVYAQPPAPISSAPVSPPVPPVPVSSPPISAPSVSSPPISAPPVSAPPVSSVPVSPSFAAPFAAPLAAPFSGPSSGPSSGPPSGPFSGPSSGPTVAASSFAAGAFAAPAVHGGAAPVRAPRHGWIWPVAGLALVVVAGVIGTVNREYARPSPIASGLLTPWLPKPVFVLAVAFVLAAVTGSRTEPAWRAIGTALAGALGGILGLFTMLLYIDTDRALTFAGGSPRMVPVSEPVFYDETLAALAIAYGLGLIVLGGFLIARPSGTLPDGPAVRAVLWAGLGAMLTMSSMSPAGYPGRDLSGEIASDVSPLRGLFASYGSLNYWTGYLLGLTLMLSAVLTIAATLRPLATRRPAARVAGAVVVAGAGAFLLLLHFADRRYVNGRPAMLLKIRDGYWSHIAWPGWHTATLTLLVTTVLITTVLCAVAALRTRAPDRPTAPH